MVLGNTKWALDFSFYVLNELFDLADDFESLSGDQEAFTQKCSWCLASTYLVSC
jgi:mediator of RNA polymerase II transcription subunit 16